MEEYNKLILLVSQMRQSQRRYFRTRAPWDLKESKRLEKLVDEHILTFKEFKQKEDENSNSQSSTNL